MTKSYEQVPSTARRARAHAGLVSAWALTWSITGLVGWIVLTTATTIIFVSTCQPWWVAPPLAALATCIGLACGSVSVFLSGKRRVYRLRDRRGVAVLLVELTSHPKTAKFASFGAVPRGQGLGTDLGRAVLDSYLSAGVPVTVYAWPPTARRYMQHGFTRAPGSKRLLWKLIASPPPAG